MGEKDKLFLVLDIGECKLFLFVELMLFKVLNVFSCMGI